MTIKITKRPDFSQITEDMEKRIQVALDRALADEIQEIISRTQAGKSIEGGTFAPYSKGRAKYRAAHGRGSIPDLTFFGSMLNSITHTVKRGFGEIIGTVFFSSSKEAAKAEGNSRYRKFFGLSKEQIKNVKDAITRAINGGR